MLIDNYAYCAVNEWGKRHAQVRVNHESGELRSAALYTCAKRERSDRWMPSDGIKKHLISVLSKKFSDIDIPGLLEHDELFNHFLAKSWQGADLQSGYLYLLTILFQ